MRVGIVGGGIAGCLLAFRLVEQHAGQQVDLLLGRHGDHDATAASGGSVRAYETDPEQRELATASLAELLDSPVLREWAGYLECGSTYLRSAAPGLDRELAAIDRRVPDSVERLDAAELARRGWSGVRSQECAVVERRAGFTDLAQLRARVLADLAARDGVALLDLALVGLDLDRTGPARVTTTDGRRDYDLVVLATGSWTPALLSDLGLPDGGFRTKAIQHVVYTATGGPSTPFVDEPFDLYGRPTVDGGLMVGVPTDGWDADPDDPAVDAALDRAARERATARFPALRLESPTTRVVATDCYPNAGRLSLRPLDGADPRLATFTGGGGGCAKTVLAASALAARTIARTLARPAQAAAPTHAG